MTELLQQAIAQIQQLSPDQQDAIAARLLAELQDEQKWEARFAATTDDQWEQMAAMVRQEIAKGETVPLEEVFPTQK
jgi:phage I-like protein